MVFYMVRVVTATQNQFRRNRTVRIRAVPPPGRRLNNRQRQQVKRLIANKEELKFFEVFLSTGLTTPAPAPSDGTLIAQGITDSQRIGDAVNLKRIEVRYIATVGDPFNFIRLILFQWHPNNVPSVGNILLNGVSGIPDMTSMYSHDNRQMFRILYDKTHFLAGNAGAATSPNSMSTGKAVTFKRFKFNKRLQYTAGTTAGTNHIYLLAFADSAVLNHPQLNLIMRSYYTDA